MKKINFLILSFLFFLGNINAQTEDVKYFDLGVELQQYPTGFLLGVKSEIGLSMHHALDFRAGYNLLDHQDFGEHEDEEGGGFGLTLGYRYYFNPENINWFIGARTDLWFNEIDWIENRNNEGEMGTSKVTVLQPTAICGYRFLVKENWVLTPTLAFGAEINIKTEGEAVGQGAIALWGMNLAYQF